MKMTLFSLMMPKRPVGAGLNEIDHLTHNVYKGRMEYWANFYEKSLTSKKFATLILKVNIQV